MKKLSAILAILLLIAFCFTACGDEDDDAPEGMKRISDPAVVGYSLYVPVAWISELNSGVVSAYHSKSDASSITVNQWNLTEEVTDIASWWAQYQPMFASTFKDFNLESEEDCYLGGVNAKKYVYTAKLPAGESEEEDGMLQFRFMQVVTVRRGMVYVFTYTSTAEVFESNLTEVQWILDAFKFH